MNSASTSSIKALTDFQWVPQPRAHQIVRGFLDAFLSRMPKSAEIARRMEAETGTRFADWVDHLVIANLPEHRKALIDAGFVPTPRAGAADCFVQEKGIFPAVILDDRRIEVGIRVESIGDFATANQLPPPSSKELSSCYRTLPIECLATAGQRVTQLLAVERHGMRGFAASPFSESQRAAALRHLEIFRARKRDFEDDRQGFDYLSHQIDAASAELGADLTCDLFFRAEREFWQSRNHAAQVQKARQDRLGLGWANHDHHTYRSSRENFARLITFFEKLGFACRERFYAGREAGWGAQVLEQPNAGIVIFADVDLSPDELLNDFSHEPLPARDVLGTVGLWCGLHGEAIFQAGMHHLECQFDFEALRRQLEDEAGVKVMKPFTDYPYLRQAFTEGERWPVAEERIASLLSRRLITSEQAAQFRQQGAIGSHLENLERNDGFKGFNQKGVSEIIEATDPRKQLRNP